MQIGSFVLLNSPSNRANSICINAKVGLWRLCVRAQCSACGLNKIRVLLCSRCAGAQASPSGAVVALQLGVSSQGMELLRCLCGRSQANATCDAARCFRTHSATRLCFLRSCTILTEIQAIPSHIGHSAQATGIQDALAGTRPWFQ